MSSKKEKKSTLIHELKIKGRINEDFVNKIADLSLEEIITIKLETAARMMKGKLYGIPLWVNFPFVIRESLMEFVIRNCKTRRDMSDTLGVSYDRFVQLYRQYVNREKDL